MKTNIFALMLLALSFQTVAKADYETNTPVPACVCACRSAEPYCYRALTPNGVQCEWGGTPLYFPKEAPTGWYGDFYYLRPIYPYSACRSFNGAACSGYKNPTVESVTGQQTPGTLSACHEGYFYGY